MKHILKCRECFDLLLDYMEGHLEPDTQSRLEEHFKSCPPCLHFLDSYRGCSKIARRLRDQQVEVPVEMESRLKSFLRHEVNKPDNS